MSLGFAITNISVLLAVSIFLFFRSIVRKNLKMFITSVAVFLVATAVAAFAFLVLVKKAVDKSDVHITVGYSNTGAKQQSTLQTS